MKYFIFYNIEGREVHARKEADYDEDENQLEEEETRELNHSVCAISLISFAF
jgi:hypothetical protein